MIAWTQLEPGLGRSVAYNVIILCGVSTLFMNGNPLLRYDGYVLSDAIEIPNLGQRANAWLGYLFKRYVLGLAAVEAPRQPGEQWWFVGYALLSFVYRMFIMFLAIFLVAGQFFFFGVLLACWAILNTIVMPLWRLARQLFTDPQIQARRGRSYAITALCVLAAAGLAGAVPMPSSTDTEGVVWVPPLARCARRWPASSASARRRTMRSWRQARRCWRWRTTNCSGATPCWPPRSTSTRRATCRRMPRIRCRPPSRAINGRAC